MTVSDIDPITLDILTSNPDAPLDSSNLIPDDSEYDDLFDLPNSTSMPISNAYEAVSVEASSAHESGVGAEHENSENLDASLNSSTKCISPIQWDHLVEIQDAVHVDAPEDEFSKEAEEVQLKISHNENSNNSSESLTSIQQNIPNDFEQLFVNAKYFLIKSNNHENVEIAKNRNAWATPTANESRLNKAYFDYNNVILIFSVRESGRFQGYARLSSPSDPRTHVPWVLPPRMSSNLLSSPFKLDWISKQDLPFPATTHLTNTWNENKAVKIGRDGQEIEPVCGEALCRLFPIDRPSEISDVISKIESRKPSGNSHRRNAFDRLGMFSSSQSNSSSSRRTRDFGFQNSGSVGLLGAATGSRYHVNERHKATSSATPLMQLNPTAAALAAAATMAAMTSNPALSRGHINPSRFSPADLSRLVASNPHFAQFLPNAAGVTPALSHLGAQLLGSSTSLERIFQGQDADRHSHSQNAESSGRLRNYMYRSGNGDRSRSSSEISVGDGRHRSGSNDYRSDSCRNRGSYRHESRTRRSRDNSRGRYDDYRRDRVINERSQSPVNTNSFMNWNYEDYLQQVSRGVNPNLNGVQSIDHSRNLIQNSSREAELNYEERVNAFLREAGTSNSRSHSRGYSPSPSRVDDLRSQSNHYDHRYGNSEGDRRRYHNSRDERASSRRSRSRSVQYYQHGSQTRYYDDEPVGDDDEGTAKLEDENCNYRQQERKRNRSLSTSSRQLEEPNRRHRRR